MMRDALLALRQLRSAWRAGEIRVLLFALMLAVAAMTAVGFFTSRIEAALERQGGMLLGGDLVVLADRPIPGDWSAEARRLGLRTAQTLEFPSMVMHGEDGRLAEIKAIGPGYPLRGQLSIADAPFAQPRHPQGLPARGEVWVEPRLASLLGLRQGDRLMLGERALNVAAVLQQEPARGGDMFSIAPRLLMNAADVESTGLIQFGSRVNYRLLVAGEAGPVARYTAWAKAHIRGGMRVETVADARPEIRTALDKARQFLGLASMASVLLALVAMSLAGLRFARRHLDTCALMRCFGASQGRILRMFAWQALFLGVLGSLAGCAVGFAAQEVLARMAGQLFLERLPPPVVTPGLVGLLSGVAAMMAVMAPPLWQLRNVPALRILRKDLGEAPPNAWLAWLPGFVVLLVLLLWSAGDVRLGAWVIVGLTALLLLAGGVVWLASVWLRRAAVRAGGVWRVVVANLRYRPALGVAQVAGLSLGLMALALLAIVRGDLIDSWRASLSPDAPNRFVINIQPDQIPALQAFFSKESLPAPHVFPMVRARLVEVDGKPVVPEKFAEDRARRLAEREWNLSVAVEMQPDNRLLAGRWWTASEQGAPLVSLEQGIAQTLDIRLGNTLTYDINGRRIALRVQSLRKVEWDSMRANFFAVVPPGVLEGYPASYITSFHLPAGQEEVLNRMVRQWPNLTVIDVEAILSQLRAIMDRMTWAVQFVFVFCLLSGLAVLYAALAATRDERAAEVALMRVYGARRHQIRAAALGEFAAIGLAAGLLASLVANVLAAVLASRLLHIAYLPDPWLAVVVVTTGGVLVPAVAWLGLSSVIRTPPRAVLQSV